MKIKCQSIFGAEPLMCLINVEKRIHALGGKAVYGWKLGQVTPMTSQYSQHVVWESPAGELMCVTPVFSKIEGQYVEVSWPDTIEFERDDAAVFRGASKYVPRIDKPAIRKACEYMERADSFLYNDLEKCRYWTDKANREVRRAGFRCGWDTPASLDVADVLATGLPQSKAG